MDEQVWSGTSVTIEATVNGQPVVATVPTHRLLINFLREDLHLTGAKRACDVQVCGACTVLVDGQPVSACTYLAFEIDGKRVETAEGLIANSAFHPVAEAFVAHGALQCGYCTAGMVMAAKSLLDANPNPSEDEIKAYMNGNLCRCTGYKKIVDAIRSVARD